MVSFEKFAWYTTLVILVLKYYCSVTELSIRPPSKLDWQLPITIPAILRLAAKCKVLDWSDSERLGLYWTRQVCYINSMFTRPRQRRQHQKHTNWACVYTAKQWQWATVQYRPSAFASRKSRDNVRCHFDVILLAEIVGGKCRPPYDESCMRP